MLHHSQSLTMISNSKKIRKPAHKQNSPPIQHKSMSSSKSLPSTSCVDPIKYPFFSNFIYYPSSIKSNILKINRKPICNDLEHLVKDLPHSNEYIHVENLRILVQDQEKLISNLFNQKPEAKMIANLAMIRHQSAPQHPIRKCELKIETKTQPQTTIINEVLNESDDMFSKDFIKKENSFYAASVSTTPSKKSSPLFNERKNLLLSSQIENILSDNYDMFVKKFDEESLNLGSLEEEDIGMYNDGFVDKEKLLEEPFFFKGLDIDRSFFSHERENLNFY